MVFECPFYAPVRERFDMLFNFLGGDAQTWASLPAVPDGDAMRQFMHQNPVLVAAFVHTCWRMRAAPDVDPEIILSSPDVLHAIAEATEFYSLSSSIVSEDEWHDIIDTP